MTDVNPFEVRDAVSATVLGDRFLMVVLRLGVRRADTTGKWGVILYWIDNCL